MRVKLAITPTANEFLTVARRYAQARRAQRSLTLFAASLFALLVHRLGGQRPRLSNYR